MSLTRALARIPSTTLLGGIVRRLFRFFPRRPVEGIRTGPLRGRRWIVASGVNGYWLDTYETEMQAAIARIVAPGGVFFDVGAHAGYYSLLASQLVGAEGRVVAFEPDARNLGYLTEHLRLNNAGNVTVVEAAVADASGAAQFAAEESSFGGALSAAGSATVDTVTIDRLMDAGTVSPPTYLKIDVEGAEFRVICGARKVLRTARPTVFLATHTPAVERLCLEALATLGYTVRPVARDAWLCVPPPAPGQSRRARG
ncbi:MAG TPA: FkbM family methyltransferase [bacterium]|nr:FkbM family methyltransferase [bacterium]